MSFNELDSASLAALANALEARAGSIDRSTPHAWQLPRPGKNSGAVAVAIDGAWLHFETPLPCRRDGNLPGPRRAMGLLNGNAFLPRGMSYCVGAHSRGTCLIADIPLHDHDADADQMLTDVQALFDTFCSTLKTPPSALAAADERSREGIYQPLTVDDEVGERARSLCDNTGWAYDERGNGRLAITLDTPGQFCQAYAYLVGESEFRLGATLEMLSEVSHTSRHAMATLLLAASRMVRMARAAVVSDAIASEYRWEVAWTQLPTPTQFHCGLSALSIACRLTLRELRALCDESIASTYLLLRRRSLQ